MLHSLPEEMSAALAAGQTFAKAQPRVIWGEWATCYRRPLRRVFWVPAP